MSVKGLKDISEEWKQKGNKSFGAGKYEESIKYYTQAINANPSNAILFSNRAMANIKLHRFFEAESDCNKALELDNSFDKAYYRRGLSRKALHLFKSALADFKCALDFAPNDDNIKKEYDLLRNLLNSTSKIKINTVLKAQKFQSTTPMKEISIVNETEMSQVNLEVDAGLAESIKKLVTSRNPKDYRQFEYDWRNLSACKLEDKVEYIESISMSSVVNIFKYPFEQQMFFEVLQTLSISKKWSHSLHVLEIISKMPRFSLNMCFFGKEELAVVNTIFNNLQQSEELDQRQVSSLHQVYSVQNY